MKVTKDTLDLFHQRKIYTTTRFGDRIKVGDELSILPQTKIEAFSGILSGNVFPSIGMASYTFGTFRVDTSIGRYSSIDAGCKLMGVQHPMDRFTSSSITYDNGSDFFKELKNENPECEFKTQRISSVKPTVIGNDVWIGADVLIKNGVTIGNGAVVAARAVVTKDIGPYEVWGGVPARLIKYRFPIHIIVMLQQLKWWNYNIADFKNIQPDTDIEVFIDEVQEQISKGTLQKYNPQITTGEEIIETLA